MCKNSVAGGYTDWRLPTIDELAAMYTEKERIGGFEQSEYWSSTLFISTSTYSKNYYYVDFFNGNVDFDYVEFHKHGRCVRTFEP